SSSSGLSSSRRRMWWAYCAQSVARRRCPPGASSGSTASRKGGLIRRRLWCLAFGHGSAKYTHSSEIEASGSIAGSALWASRGSRRRFRGCSAVSTRLSVWASPGRYTSTPRWSRSGCAVAAATMFPPRPLPTSTTSSARRPKTSSRSSRAPSAGSVSRSPRGGSSTYSGESRSQESRREGVRRSPRRTQETTSRRVVPASRRAGCRGGGVVGGVTAASGRATDLIALDDDLHARQVTGRGADQHLAAGRVEARTVAGAVQLGLLLAEGAAAVGAVAGAGGGALPGPADEEHEGLLAAEVHQRRGVLGHVRQRDRALLRAERLGRAEALVLRSA